MGTVFSRIVVVPDDVASLNSAINKLAAGDGCALGKGLVLVRPGVYAESLRITQNCHILGWGPCDKVVVEAPGWESALVSAGLGGRKVPTLLGWETLESGEDARVENLTFRCRNESMQGRCVYIVMGQLHLVRCSIEGGVLVSGACTAPYLSDCHIRKSRGNGVHLTDHCKAALRRNVVAQHGRHGVLIDRHSSPEVIGNTIRKNAICGIRIFQGASRPLRSYLVTQGCVRDNHFEENGEAEISTSPEYAEAEDSSSEEEDKLWPSQVA